MKGSTEPNEVLERILRKLELEMIQLENNSLLVLSDNEVKSLSVKNLNAWCVSRDEKFNLMNEIAQMKIILGK